MRGLATPLDNVTASVCGASYILMAVESSAMLCNTMRQNSSDANKTPVCSKPNISSMSMNKISNTYSYGILRSP